MKKKITIGKKLRKRDVVKTFIIINIFALILLMVMLVMIFPAVNVTFEIKFIFAILLFLGVWALIVPMIGSTQRLEVSGDGIKYYHVEGSWNQFKEIIRLFCNKNEKPNFSLPLNQIKKVALSYRLTLGGYGLKGFTIVLTFLLNDNTMVKFIPFNISGGGNNNKLYLDLLYYLQDYGIEIEDRYQLMNKLNLDNQEILDYISQVGEHI